MPSIFHSVSYNTNLILYALLDSPQNLITSDMIDWKPLEISNTITKHVCFFLLKRIMYDVDPSSYKFIKDLAYPIETQILKFWILGVVIHPEM